jgi:hypothetical protein
MGRAADGSLDPGSPNDPNDPNNPNNPRPGDSA